MLSAHSGGDLTQSHAAIPVIAPSGGVVKKGAQDDRGLASGECRSRRRPTPSIPALPGGAERAASAIQARGRHTIVTTARRGNGRKTAATGTLLLSAAAMRRRFNRSPTDRFPAWIDAARKLDDPSSPVWEWSVDVAGNFIDSNGAGLDMIGYSPVELIGRSATMVLDPAELKRALEVTEALGGAGEGWQGVFVEVRHRNGSTVWLQVTIHPRFDAAGNVVGASGATRLVGPDAEGAAERERVTRRVEKVLAGRLLETTFQPIVSLAGNNVIGVESLSRFSGDPALSPDHWFADAASVGLGTRLELVAIGLALAAARALPEHLYVSVNASPTTCVNPELAGLIADSAIDPARIVLELTEHDMVGDYGALISALSGLRRQGVKLAVDDAGSGFSSFQHILRLQPHIIKLDRCLVADLDSSPAARALCMAVVSFAARIGAHVIAEGIETPGELSAVTELGMLAGQGFYLGRPSHNPAVWAQWQPDAKAAHHVQLAISIFDRADVPNVDRVPPANTVEFTPEFIPVGISDNDVPTSALHDADLAAAVFEALPDATAVLDRHGTITAANRAWRMFAEDNGGRQDETGVGVNYLDVCTRAAQSGCSAAVEVLAGLRAVLAGGRIESEQEYSCDSPTASRWFSCRISAINSPTGGAIASHVNITRRKRTELENQHQPLHDPLTGVTNQVLFRKRLSAELRRETTTCQLHPGVGVIYLRVEGLAEVNDAFGNCAGDEMLLVAAHRMLVHLRQADTLGRLGGARFAVCATRTTAAHLGVLADRIAAALTEPQQIRGQQVYCRASVGIYLAGPDDTVSHAMLSAEQAMYAYRHPEPKQIPA